MKSAMEFEEVVSGLGVLEAPRIDADGSLYFSDLFDGGVHRVATGGAHDVLLPGRKHIGGLVLDESGGLVLAGREQPLAFWDAATDEVRLLASALDGVPIVSVNDIEADTVGSVWAGTMDLPMPATTAAARQSLSAPRASGATSAWTHAPASIFRVDADGSVTKLWEEGTVANGLGFSPDGRLLYQCDTNLGVFAYDITGDRELRDRRLFGRVPDGGHNGLVVDVEGAVWVAAVGGGAVVRFRADAVIDAVIEVPAVAVMSLEFGGPDSQDLYVVTADNRDHPVRHGTVFRARSDVPGIPGRKSNLR